MVPQGQLQGTVNKQSPHPCDAVSYKSKCKPYALHDDDDGAAGDNADDDEGHRLAIA